MLENTLLSKENIKVDEEYNKNFKYFINNFDKIKNDNKGKFIAIYNSNILISEKDHNFLLRKLEKAGIAQDSVFIKYISDSDELLVI